jgi:alpha-1,2-glucosyltransferase
MLLEFRYFLLPYLYWRLHTRKQSYHMPRVMLELILNCILNTFVIYMFLMRPFNWPNESAVQRFMW